MKEESLLLLSDLQKLINQVVLIDYTIIILGGEFVKKADNPVVIVKGDNNEVEVKVNVALVHHCECSYRI